MIEQIISIILVAIGGFGIGWGFHRILSIIRGSTGSSVKTQSQQKLFSETVKTPVETLMKKKKKSGIYET